MIKIRKNRLYAVLFILGSSLLATILVLTALNQNINLFYSPSDLFASNPSPNKSIRVGGLVQKGSLMRIPDSLEINFTITDLKEEVTVNYSGILPDLFKEDAGVVATGYYDQTNNSFQAFEILAKHDENYEPKEVVKALEGK